MRSKIILRRTLLLIFVLILFIFLLLFVYQSRSASATSTIKIGSILPHQNTATTSTEEQIVLALPARLKIPQIGVDASIETVGFALNGTVDVPKNQKNVAWFNPGPRPGEIGNAIITGHYGWKDKNASAFDNLYKLRPGDKLFIEDDQGTTTTFVVQGNRRYGPNASASKVFVSKDNKSHLNLITCEGDWNEAIKSYTKRLVIFADKE